MGEMVRRAEYRAGGAGDPAELRQHRPHLRRHPKPAASHPPLGFDISEKAVRRAGLDYWHMVDLTVYDNIDHFFSLHPQPDVWLATTKAPRDYSQARFSSDCWLMFGKETAGLPGVAAGKIPQPLHPHPHAEDARSLNLANSVASDL